MTTAISGLSVKETHGGICDGYSESPHPSAELEQWSGVTKNVRLSKALGRNKVERRQR